MAQITLRDYLQQTEDAISASRIDDALTHCQFMLSYFPEALEIQRLLGKVYLTQGRMEEAQHLFDWVLTNDPENVLAYCNRAHLSECMSEYDVALDCYQQAYELSRGNGQIREEFNQLSEKVGQKGFMFSRAGLARLYMRGDSLSEAIQEWETVLATAPDRLDARTGLLETYWRAGLLENVEELADQILHQVPGCIKALFLHACVISSKDSQLSQELLRRAEALDPDFTAVQALFADGLASHPDDPFLRQLKKAPALLPEPKSLGLEQAQGQQQNSFAPVSDPINALGNSVNVDALAQWGKDAYGSTDITLVKPRSNMAPAPSNMGVTPLWGQESIHDNLASLPGIALPISTGTPLQASWNVPIQETNNTPSSPQTQTGTREHSPEPWELLQDALNQFDAVGAEPRIGTGSSAVPYEEGLPLWENRSGSGQPALDISQSAPLPIPKQQESISSPGIKLDPWGVPIEEPLAPAAENSSPAPDWLNMLAQTDLTAREGASSAPTLQPQSDNRLPAVDSSLEQQAQPNTTSSEAQNSGSFIPQSPSQPPSLTIGASPMAIEKVESPHTWLETSHEEKLGEDEDEESFFGPSWLKSIGATTMAEEETPAATTAPAPETQTPYIAQPEYTGPQHEEHSHAPLAQRSGELTQVPSADYPETQSAQYHSPVPETHSYESWSQASSNNAPIYDLASGISSETVQELEKTNRGTGSLHEDAYAAGTSWPHSSVDVPTEQPVQEETAHEKAEQNLVATLEELEQSLWSKGFIPLEPNSLATLATQTQESSVSSHDLDTLKAPREYEAQGAQQPTSKQEQEEPQEMPDAPSLSSALAQLGNIVKEASSPAAPSPAPSFGTLEQNEEPSWLQALRNFPATPAFPATPIWPDTSLEPSMPAAYAENVPQPSPVPVEPIIATSHNLTQPAAKGLQQTMKAPAMRGNPLLDVEGELETTMKRPAVRLQSMQHRPSSSQRPEGAASVSRSQSRERVEKAPRVTKPANENLSYQDRLVKGYQYQLVGDYDEAMQEYRIIIRSGTDLLNEVISNVRALLKLAPNYSAGYRVLGDAYMRQGEYLQAMEAYNKALTMTKKVKSRV